MSWEEKRMTPTSVGTIYSYVEVRDWETSGLYSTYRHNGGAASKYNWTINVYSKLKWWENGVWHDVNLSGAEGTEYFDHPYDSSDEAFCTPVDVNDSFVRGPEDRTVWLGCYSEISRNGTTASALAEIGPYRVPHLAGTPTNLKAVWAGSNSILLTWDNPPSSYHGISMEYREADGGEWAVCWYYDGAGYPVEYTFENADTSKSYEFRCQVVYYENWGGYSNTASVEVQAPLAPTVLEPIGNVELSSGVMRFSWIHNYSLPQSSFKIKWKVNDSSERTFELGSASSSYMMPSQILQAGAGDTVSFQIATKSEATEYSPFSEPTTFTICSKPGIVINSPEDGGTLSGMPIEVSARYQDTSGFSCDSAYVELLKDGQQVYFTTDCTISPSYISKSIDVQDFLPDNHQLYEVRIGAASTSGLSNEDSVSFTTDFAEPVEGDLEVVNDTEAGTVSLTVTFDNESDPQAADAARVTVHRENRDGTRTLILDATESGEQVVDKYAPLNTAYRYAVTTVSDEGATKTVYFDNLIRSDKWFVYWGENVAQAKWNPNNGGIQISRPQKTRVHYVGRKDPVSYDGSAVSLSETPSWMFVGQDEVLPFVRLIDDGGRGVYKSCDGWVYHADFDLTINPSYTAIGYYGGATLSITRIAGRAL